MNTLVPRSLDAKATNSGPESVGKPGYGSVDTVSKAPNRLSDVSNMSLSDAETVHPQSFSTVITGRIRSGCTFLSRNFPEHAAPAKRYVAATMRSGMTVYSVLWSFFTPFIIIVSLPSPEMSAPQPLKKPQRSDISGSRAAFLIVVVPLPVAAASRMFSVAPTLGHRK